MDTLSISHETPEWVKQLNRRAHSDLLADRARRQIDVAVTEYKLDGIVALFSGGHDSLTCTHVASKHPLFKGVIHIDTGTGLPQTRQFVEETCKREGWDLIIQKPATTYEMLIVKYGFPGAAQHAHMYRYLKERPLAQAKTKASQRYGCKRIGFITGVRSQESARRMGHVEAHHKDKAGVWVAIIHDWSALDCNQYVTTHHLPRNPVKDTMHLSGECFCGSFARPEEKRELEVWYPEHAKKIEAWQELVRTAVNLGLSSIPFNHQQWGHGGNLGKSAVPDEQLELLPMCWFCRGDNAA